MRDLLHDKGIKVLGLSAFLPRCPDGLDLTIECERGSVDSALELLHLYELVFGLKYVGCGCAFDDQGTTFANLVCACLGFPHNDLAKAVASRDKSKMREAVQAAGLRGPKFAAVSFLHDLPAWLLNGKGPFVVKTPRGAGSKCVFVCGRVGSVKEKVQEVFKTPDIYGKIPSYALVEQYVHGAEFSVNMFAHDGDIVVTDIWKYDKRDTPGGHVLYYRADLMDSSDSWYDSMKSYAIQVSRAVGIRVGPAHLELRVTSAGPVMIEIASRFSGGNKPALASDAIPGLDLCEAYINASMRLPVDSCLPRSLKPSHRVRHCFFPNPHSGVIAGYGGIPEIEALDTYLSHTFRFDIGQAVLPSTHLFSYPFELFLITAGSTTQLDADERRARRLFQLHLQPLPTPPPPPDPVSPPRLLHPPATSRPSQVRIQ